MAGTNNLVPRRVSLALSLATDAFGVLTRPKRSGTTQWVALGNFLIYNRTYSLEWEDP